MATKKNERVSSKMFKSHSPETHRDVQRGCVCVISIRLTASEHRDMLTY